MTTNIFNGGLMIKNEHLFHYYQTTSHYRYNHRRKSGFFSQYLPELYAPGRNQNLWNDGKKAIWNRNWNSDPLWNREHQSWRKKSGNLPMEGRNPQNRLQKMWKLRTVWMVTGYVAMMRKCHNNNDLLCHYFNTFYLSLCIIWLPSSFSHLTASL